MKKMLLLCFALTACTAVIRKEDHQILEVLPATSPIFIDGRGDESVWDTARWLHLDQPWKGDSIAPEDFRGRYKLLWDARHLYLYVEVRDDSLFDWSEDPLKVWWADDALQLFIDEDNSGGLHQYNNNAFAYHLSPDGTVIDLGENRKPRVYSHHIRAVHRQEDKMHFWEIALNVYPAGTSGDLAEKPVPLFQKKKVGFALAYKDNDGSQEVEHMIGSVHVPGDQKDTGWINADIFGTLVLVE